MDSLLRPLPSYDRGASVSSISASKRAPSRGRVRQGPYRNSVPVLCPGTVPRNTVPEQCSGTVFFGASAASPQWVVALDFDARLGAVVECGVPGVVLGTVFWCSVPSSVVTREVLRGSRCACSECASAGASMGLSLEGDPGPAGDAVRASLEVGGVLQGKSCWCLEWWTPSEVCRGCGRSLLSRAGRGRILYSSAGALQGPTGPLL